MNTLDATPGDTPGRAPAVAPVCAMLRRKQLAAVAVIVAAAAAILAIFWDTALSIEGIWAASDLFGHGFLILPIVAYLVWRQRVALARAVPTTSVWGLAMMAAMAAGWLLGDLTAVMVVKQFALVGMIQGLVLAVLGVRATRLLLFPLAYLYFGVPFGAFLIEPLQGVTAEFVVSALRFSGIPVYLDGLFIHVANGSFEVAAACSGTRFLISTVALASLGANLFYRSVRRRVLFLALAVVVPIIANGMRAYGIVMLAHLSNFRWGVGEDHVTMGLIFMSMVTLALLFFGMSMREQGAGEPSGKTSDRSAAGGGRAVGPTRLLGFAVVAVLVAAAAPGYGHVVEQRVTAVITPQLSAPPGAGPWLALESADKRWYPAFVAPDAEVFRTYAAGDRRVDFYFAFYSHQRQGAEVVNFRNRFVDDRTWKRAGSGKAQAIVDGVAVAADTTRILSTSGGRVVWSWYWVDDTYTGNAYLAKLLELKARLFGGNPSAGVFAVATDYVDIPGEASAVLKDFLANIHPIAVTGLGATDAAAGAVGAAGPRTYTAETVATGTGG